jgi:phospholipid/cholesterol/gamma-HCH transport system ATP-binding protein
MQTDLPVPEGPRIIEICPSGTGKSVCIKHMVGLLLPDRGDVLVHGDSVPAMSDGALNAMRRRFGVLFQDGALFGSMNLFDNVAFPLRQHTDKGEEEIGENVTRRLREVGLEDAADRMPNQLSGGMRKRAGFARALVLDPDIVLFDEPDSGLDPVRTALLCELIKEIHAENGGAYVVITHDILSARRIAEYIAVLWQGRIVQAGSAQELFDSEDQFVRQFLSGASTGPLGME